MTAPAALRGVLLCLLAAALVLAFGGDAVPAGAPLDVTEGADADALVQALSRGVPPSRVLRRAEAPPTLAEAELMEAASTFSPLLVRAPDEGPLLVASRPEGLVQGRTATLAFQLSGWPDDALSLRMEGERGSADSVVVPLDADGGGEGFFRIRPARAGWYDWRIEAGEEGEPRASAMVGAWVRESDPLRVLVVGGAPTWESRFLLRALEEEGVSIGVHQNVGRDLAVTSEVERAPLTVEALSEWDALILLPGAPLGPQRLSTIEAWVVERGGGVAVAGAGEAPGEQGPDGVLARLGLASGVAPARDATGTALRWSLPPEIAPLPEEPVSFSVRTFLGPREGALTGAIAGGASDETAGAGDAGAPALLLGATGRGRVAAVGLRETWRWRMESGRTTEHRDFWRTLSEWLAGGLRAEWSVVAEHTHVPVGATVAARIIDVEGAGMENAPALALSGPVGETVLEVDDHGVARFLAGDPGVYALSLEGASATAAVSATSGAVEDPAGWMRLARAAYASGREGGVVDADSARLVAAAFGRADGLARRWREVLPLLFFIGLVSLGVGEWTLRRVRGLP